MTICDEPITSVLTECPACEGQGGWEEYWREDRTYFHACDHCDGTGEIEEELVPVEMDESCWDGWA